MAGLVGIKKGEKKKWTNAYCWKNITPGTREQGISVPWIAIKTKKNGLSYGLTRGDLGIMITAEGPCIRLGASDLGVRRQKKGDGSPFIWGREKGSIAGNFVNEEEETSRREKKITKKKKKTKKTKGSSGSPWWADWWGEQGG